MCSKIGAVNKHGSPDDMNRMMARLEAELARPDPDDGPIIDFPEVRLPW